MIEKSLIWRCIVVCSKMPPSNPTGSDSKFPIGSFACCFSCVQKDRKVGILGRAHLEIALNAWRSAFTTSSQLSTSRCSCTIDIPHRQAVMNRGYRGDLPSRLQKSRRSASGTASAGQFDSVAVEWAKRRCFNGSRKGLCPLHVAVQFF